MAPNTQPTHSAPTSAHGATVGNLESETMSTLELSQSTDVATVTTSTDVATMAESPALTWETKTGKTRAAFTPAAAARGNREARLKAADAATVAQLQNNTFRPFLRDVASKLTAAHVTALRAHVAAALSTMVDGVPMLPAGDVLSVSNKKAAIAVATWLQAPTATVKGVTSAKPLPASAAYLCAIAAAWVAPVADVAPAATEETTEAAVADTVAEAFPDAATEETVAEETVAEETVAEETVAEETEQPAPF
jgi:hypothetical protein